MPNELIRYGAGAESSQNIGGNTQAGGMHSDFELDPRNLIRALWRRKFILLSVIAVITGGTIAYVQ
ncbi:MAG: hypothetical protein AAFY56_18275, partial [Pseudomonadota bacterium]